MTVHSFTNVVKHYMRNFLTTSWKGALRVLLTDINAKSNDEQLAENLAGGSAYSRKKWIMNLANLKNMLECSKAPLHKISHIPRTSNIYNISSLLIKQHLVLMAVINNLIYSMKFHSET